MGWPAVARAYLRTFERARAEGADRRRTAIRARTLASRPELPAASLTHLQRMTDDTGMLQHAAFSVPCYDDGYCVDDNARALIVMELVAEAGTEPPALVRTLQSRYLAFLRHAWNPAPGRFRNFMSYSRRWQEELGSEDSHGRSLWALGTVVGRSADPGRQSLGHDLFHAALPAASGFTSPRAWAFALLGIGQYLRSFEGDSVVQDVRQRLAERLFALYRRTSTPDWPWFEDRLTYCNARLPHALLLSGSRMAREDMVEAGLASLEWLVSTERSPDGYFAPVGSNGFHVRGGARARFDQQPVEASAMVSACLEAGAVTHDERWAAHARRAFDWFLGQNELQRTLYDAGTGGCRDGLHEDRVNENQGAESTLSFLAALLEMRAASGPLEASGSARFIRGTPGSNGTMPVGAGAPEALTARGEAIS
jgi:hypothetical protein